MYETKSVHVYLYNKCVMTSVVEIGDTIQMKIHSVDQIGSDDSRVTIWCTTKMVVDCTYEDYSRGSFETDDYDSFQVSKTTIREEHMAKFACEVKINRATGNIYVLPFKVLLGGDTRIKEV